VRTKTSRLIDGRVRGGIRFSTGALAHLLKNRFYVGEVTYRGAIHRGSHQPLIERELFEAVQARLAANAVGRQTRLRGSPAILTGRIFDDCGNRMSPSHTNKLGVRYRYYVSHAILQQRRSEVGSVGRVPAAEIEKLVLEGVRSHQASEGGAASAIGDRDLIEQRVQSVAIRPKGIEVRILAMGQVSDGTGVLRPDGPPDNLPMTIITLPWAAPGFAAVSRDLLVLGVTYRLQEIEHGGLGKATLRKLRTLAKTLRATGRVGPTPSLSLKPGARLVREWRGHTHTVSVTEDGFEYAGTNYPSLTKIARKITGAHWSGPRFFGLPAKHNDHGGHNG
jgi:Protein of unknown function (DUF2924)/Recombinase